MTAAASARPEAYRRADGYVDGPMSKNKLEVMRVGAYKLERRRDVSALRHDRRYWIVLRIGPSAPTRQGWGRRAGTCQRLWNRVD